MMDEAAKVRMTREIMQLRAIVKEQEEVIQQLRGTQTHVWMVIALVMLASIGILAGVTWRFL